MDVQTVDVEQLIYEANTLLNAAALMNRLGVKQQ
jgi:hypothetical protein